jgi:hypothetical protein
MRKLATVVGSAWLLAAASGVACAGEWQTYESDRYGFSMSVPPGTKLVDKDRDDGWGLLHGEKDGVELYACAQLGRHYEAKEIEDFGVKVTGIAADNWREIDAGKTREDWTWYKTVVATEGETAYAGIYGIGPRGSYLLLLKTTVADYQENKAAYRRWYDGIKLHGGWELFHAKDYGFTMLIPSGTKLATAEDGGWGALTGEKDGVAVFGLAKKGEQAKAEEIEDVGVEVTEVAAEHWKQVDGGEKTHGWTWWKTVKAQHGDQALVGIYGVGPKGSFMLVMKTTASDYAKNKACYDYWYEHIWLD